MRFFKFNLRSDLDQLLSVRLKQDDRYNWSGGFKIDEITSFYIILRSCMDLADLVYLKIDLYLDGGTFYIVFSERLDLPFPLRIENFADVPIYVHQPQTVEEYQSLSVRPHHSLDYSWDEPAIERKLIIGIKGGTQTHFVLDSLSDQDTKYLYYESFIYIGFEDIDDDEKSRLVIDGRRRDNRSSSSSSKLVLTSINNRVYLDEKEPGNRAQLWSLTLDGYLIHEGSSPPRDLEKELKSPLDMSTRYVLDIEDAAPRPNHLIPLTLRRADLRRKNTQRWFFDKTGLLMCNVRNMCLQVKGELRRHALVVLGPQSDYQVKLKYTFISNKLKCLKVSDFILLESFV